MAAKSSSELIEKFSRASTATKVGVFVAIAAVLGGLYWYMFYSDIAQQLDEAKEGARKLASDEVKLKERQKQYRELLDKKKAIEDGLAKNQIALPASSELPSFFVSLQSQAIAASVQLVSWNREDEVPVETYVKVPVKMEVRGDFYQILQYFKLLFETRRIITVENLLIGNGVKDGDDLLLTAKFTASTFRQADQPPAPAKPAPGQPPKPGQPPAAGQPPPRPGAPAPATPGARPVAPATPPPGPAGGAR
jgi:type IV pilus assembly protein PilO